MVVIIADMPEGAPNRLAMADGCYALFAIATIAVLVRMYVRIYMSRKTGLDDIFIIAAWISEAAVIVAVKLQFENGIGWHAKDIMHHPQAKEILTRAVLWPWVAQFLYFFGLGCIKASIVALYLRLAVNPTQRKILWATLVFVFGQGFTSAIVVACFLCKPISTVWTGGFGGPLCINILVFNYYNAAVFIFTDVIIALAPIAVLRNMQMDRKRKASLGMLFSLGMLAIGGTISRQITNAIAINNPADFTWYWAPAELCSVLESSLGIVFVCVPAMAPLFTSWFGSFGHSGKRSSSPEFQSDRPSTFGKLGGRPKLRPDNESIFCETQITALDAKDNDTTTETYEMDHSTTTNGGDSGSERRIITPPMTLDERQKRVRVDVEYGIERSERHSSNW